MSLQTLRNDTINTLLAHLQRFSRKAIPNEEAITRTINEIADNATPGESETLIDLLKEQTYFLFQQSIDTDVLSGETTVASVTQIAVLTYLTDELWDAYRNFVEEKEEE